MSRDHDCQSLAHATPSALRARNRELRATGRYREGVNFVIGPSPRRAGEAPAAFVEATQPASKPATFTSGATVRAWLMSRGLLRPRSEDGPSATFWHPEPTLRLLRDGSERVQWRPPNEENPRRRYAEEDL
jgi:hypothetical protein